MLIGQSLLAPVTPVDYYMPWFPRGGNVGSMVIEVLRISSASCTLTVTMEQKDADESDAAATSAGAFAAGITATGTYPGALTSAGIKQLVRCKLTLKSVSAVVEWMHLRVNAPIWQPN